MRFCEHYRFIERDYWFHKAVQSSEHLSVEQIDTMLDRMALEWKDLTFKFYPDGSVTIMDNESQTYLKPGDLTGASLDFYIRKRIRFIKVMLSEQQLKYA
ncbi:hypothetical protein SY83_17455 [Paenibacillus swuensis]|uniref:Uncharacterized protein n=1 Tax=Paenibacillus swuensis TaxID=1178515 RepID=A0A172TLW3_9BACL|nr:hypothetical protein [Paenibacillus swuensis]ANE47773.1 hypothetical protein SY83_17455 [Paenibacillus swuensis]